MGLFGKKRDKTPVADAPEIQVSPERRQELQAELAALAERLEAAPADERPMLLNAVGKAHEELREHDDAISAYERSMGEKEQFGDAYNALLNLYNLKLKQGAKAKDNEAIQTWTSKLDELMALSKRVMRSNY